MMVALSFARSQQVGTQRAKTQKSAMIRRKWRNYVRGLAEKTICYYVAMVQDQMVQDQMAFAKHSSVKFGPCVTAFGKLKLQALGGNPIDLGGG